MSQQEVLKLLFNNDYSAGELSKVLDLTRNRTSANLRALREKGLIKMIYKTGYKVPVYAITAKGVELLKGGWWG